MSPQLILACGLADRCLKGGVRFYDARRIRQPFPALSYEFQRRHDDSEVFLVLCGTREFNVWELCIQATQWHAAGMERFRRDCAEPLWRHF